MADSPVQPDPVTVSLAVVWQGSSGKQDARMSEISMNGCFIDSSVQRRALGDIVVADDDPLTLRMVTAVVENEGYQAVSAADGRQALTALQQADMIFSAAIFDMMMPHLQGLDLILYMKADERLRRIPVGMITAERDPKVWDDSVAAGACVFLPKPFTPPQVQMMLRMLASKAE